MTATDPRAALHALAAIERGSAGPGEERAAELIAGLLGEHGLEAWLEREPAVGGFWQSTGLAAAAGALAGAIGLRGGSPRRRAAALALSAAAAGAMADDVDGGRHHLRWLLRKRSATNVLAWAGDPAARETVVIVAHHDAAHTGLLFHPGLVPALARRFPDWYARQNTSVQTGRLLVAGPLLVALGNLLGVRAARALGTVWSAVTALLLADVARSPVVCGANDNLSAVAVLLDLARRLENRPVAGVRVLLLSTGSEESFMEGMRGFVARHRAELDPDTTRVIALECVGSPHLMLMEGEGMLLMRDHDAGLREEIQRAADRVGIGLWRGLRLGAGATDALPALRAGYRTACLAACDEYKTPANYHWPSDVPENLDWNTIDAAGDVLDSLLRGLGAEEEPSGEASTAVARS
ncbi:MAG TPA: M28 family peptidase [Solirubrobacteraceae bacterium]|nr:M28 family peptidase [Solirubrobacteraceae bacterium]